MTTIPDQAPINHEAAANALVTAIRELVQSGVPGFTLAAKGRRRKINTTATLSEKLDCATASKKARAAVKKAKKAKTRKLWGEGKGKFRTRGQYSAATIRGTKWFLQDTCTSTITKVKEGVVEVRDEVKKRTIVLLRGEGTMPGQVCVLSRTSTR